MKMMFFVLQLFVLIGSAFAQEHSDVLWNKLKTDFENKPYFFNASINDERSGSMSSFINKYFKEYAYNNALPLSANELSKLPEGEFLDIKPFTLAMEGRNRLLKAGKIKDWPLVAIADMSQHSRQRRFYILDVHKGEVLINTWTSHAFKSDVDHDGIAETFSNIPGSSQTSLGFMKTDLTYEGAYGYSLRLKGLDQELNSNVYKRSVVVHGYGGLDPHQAANGNISYSEGCLMISLNESGLFWGMKDESMRDIVINTLKQGALVFVYSDISDDNGNELIFKSDWIKPTDL